MRQVNALRFRDETKKGTVTIEAPGTPFFDNLEVGFAVTVKRRLPLRGDCSRGRQFSGHALLFRRSVYRAILVPHMTWRQHDSGPQYAHEIVNSRAALSRNLCYRRR